MELGIQGKYALVTGATRGLGRAVASALAAEGVKVALVARDKDMLDTVIAELGGSAMGHVAIPLDLMSQGSGQILHQELLSRTGSPDIIVHNLGGTLGIREPLGNSSDYQQVWQFNLGIAIDLNKLFLPAMVEKGWGRIVHVSSLSAVMVDSSLPYATAKAGLNAYIKGLGRELAPSGVVVSGIMPGPFLAEDGHWDRIAREDPERYSKFCYERMAIQRLGTTEEITGIITFLCSQQASFFSGCVVPVDGGMR
ncbi:MAG: SDR family NAD(P)-dependent oxidoreductase [Acidobacteriota bacterium]